MKIFKRVLKILGVVLGCLLITLLMAFTTLWFFPGIVLHESTFARYIEPRLKNMDIHLKHQNLKLRARSESFWEKSLQLEAAELCFQLAAKDPQSCLGKVDLQIRAKLGWLKLRELFIDRLIVLAPDFRYQHTPAPESDSSFNPWPLMRKTRVGEVNVKVEKFEILLPDDSFTGTLAVTNDDAEGFIAKAHAVSRTKKSFEEADVELSRERLRNLAQVFRLNKAKAVVKIAPKEEARVEMERQRVQRGEFAFKLSGDYRSPAVRVELKSEVDQKQKRNLDGSLTGRIFLPKLLAGPIVIRQCKFEAVLPEEDATSEKATPDKSSAKAERDDDSAAPLDRAKLECALDLATRYLVKEAKVRGTLPPKFDLKLLGNAAKKEGPSGNQELVGALRLEVGPFASSMIQGRLAANYDINFTRDDVDSRIDFDPIRIDGDVTVLKFREFAKVLNASRLIVPSPFNVLDGRVKVEAKGELHPQPFSGETTVKLSTDLKSTNQALDLLADGRLSFVSCQPPAKNTFLQVELNATNMRLKLPNIDYKDPPAFVPDSRFVLRPKKPPPKKSACGLEYVFNFKNQGQPIYLLSDFLKKDLPLSLVLRAQSEQPTQGQVKVTNYSTTLFRRRATVDHFNLDFKTKRLDSRIRVDYADYKVYILLSGTTQSVRMTLESDPPLPRDQVIAILLFGKTLDTLEPDETGSVKDVSAAAKDGALTLASLYIFASTPIESVGYNPHTNGLVAKVKLRDGTTLNVGANSQGLRDVGIGQRLSKHWRIQTTLKDPSEENERSASTMLEWFHRF